jgi:hypothetical protein
MNRSAVTAGETAFAGRRDGILKEKIADAAGGGERSAL